MDDLTADRKRFRQVHGNLGLRQVTDYEIGRFLDAIEELGEMDNTMVIYITGDNGPVFQGGPSVHSMNYLCSTGCRSLSMLH